MSPVTPVPQSSPWHIIASVFIAVSIVAFLLAIVLVVVLIIVKKYKRNLVVWNDDHSKEVAGIALNPLSPSRLCSVADERARSERTGSNATSTQLLEFSNSYSGRGVHTEPSTTTSHTLPSMGEEASSYSPSQVTSSPATSGIGASNGVDTISELIDMRVHGGGRVGGGPLHSSSMASTVFTTGSYDPSQVGGIWF